MRFSLASKRASFGRNPRQTPPKRSLAIASIGLLVAVNVVLIGLLFDRPDADPSAVMLNELNDDRELRPSANPSPTPEPVIVIDTAPTQYVLNAVNDSVAWRATTGECPQAMVTPELTSDGGQNWRATDATLPTGITALQRIIALSAEQARFVGFAADGCEAVTARTFVSGDNYSLLAGGAAQAWWIPAADRTVIHSPQRGLVDAPCDAVRGVAVTSDTTAAVLCADATVLVTTTSADSFSAPLPMPGAQSVTAIDAGYLVASVGVIGCAGVTLTLVTAEGSSAAPVGCLESESSAADLAGRVAISSGGGILWVWAGDQLARSDSNGATWL